MSVAGRSTYAANIVDPQRSASTAVAASQGPVLSAAAWGVVGEPPQFPSAPFPEMPPAAAAAVSPVVPGAPAAAAPPDPYGRCWQNQVDAGACFPYFGTLYGSSLPPPSYRMQPGCMSNLGQFWPPTPPPDGCVRYDSANNIHFCSPLTPMFRHSESLPQNMLGVHHQRLGHYSHLIDVNKDAGLKRLDACMDNVQRQKVALASKHSKDVIQQRLCHCYECNEKNSRGLTPSINKENISRSVESRYLDEKLKSKNCKKSKEENIAVSRTATNYHPNSSAITGYSCSVDQNTARTVAAMQNLPSQVSLARNSQKSDSGIVTSSGLQYEFSLPNSTANNGICCSSNSVFTVPSSNVISPIVSTAIKCPEQSRYENVIEKAQQRRLPTSIPGFDSYSCPSVSTPSSSHAHHPNDKSCCFSPPYLSSRTLYPNHSENYTHNKAPNAFVIHGNNYNASPLKNVYFSYYESENFDLASDSSTRRSSKSNLGKQEKVSNISYINNRPPSEKQVDYLVSTAANCVHSVSPALNNSYSYRSQQKNASVPITIHGPLQQTSFIEQHKNDANFCNYLGTTSNRRSEKSAFSRQLAKATSAFIKQEKSETFDCKFQQSTLDDNMRIPPLPVSTTSSGALNLSTSLRCPKIEPDTAHCDAIANSSSEIHPSTSLATTTAATVLPGVSVQTVLCKPAEPTFCQVSKCSDVASGYASNSLPFCRLEKSYGIQDATSLRMHRAENQCAPVVPEDLVSVGQVAPTVDELVLLDKIPPTGSEAPLDVNPLASVADAEEDETTSKSHQESASSLVAVQPMESADVSQFMLHSKKLHNTSAELHEKSTELSGLFSSCDVPSEELKFFQGAGQSSPDRHVVEDLKLNGVVEVIDFVKIKAEELTSSHSVESQNVSSSESVMYDDTTLREEKEVKYVEPKELKSKCDMNNSEEFEASNFIKTEMDAPLNRHNECHGLYLLLQGIDQKCNNEKTDIEEQLVLQNADTSTFEDSDSNQVTENTVTSNSSDMKGLNLLCALVEHQLAEEFGIKGECKIEKTEDSEKPVADTKPACPSIETEHSYPTRSKVGEASSSTETTSKEDDTVLEMRKKLAELQQQYKEKQKELARLRPKKNTFTECSKKSIESRSQTKAATASNSTSPSATDLCENSSLPLNSSFSSNCSNENSTTSAEKLSEDECSNKQSSPQTAVKANINSPSVKAPAKIIKSIVSKSKTEDATGSSSNNKSSSANLALKIDISLGICKTSKRTVRRSLVKRKLQLRSSKHTITLSESKETKQKPCRNSKTRRLRNSFLRSDDSNQGTKSNDSSSVNDDAKPAKRTEKKGKSPKKKNAKSEENEPVASCSSKKSRLASTLDCDVTVVDEIQSPTKSPKKRKAENPKKFMPSKQVRLTETIIAKQLRNRILFESRDGQADDKKAQMEYDVPEELFDALRKCHLGESNQSCEKHTVASGTTNGPNVNADAIDSCSKDIGSGLRMTPKNLVENQRILALEEGLLYAGCIKEIQNNDAYGIVLDGQRGNKKHIFTREEMLTQTILESKPNSINELPEGTRVCAYWSHQYRCLYPGTVMKAPAPSADWSEPRAFVEFDDGDSAQIATKNIRFLPEDMHFSEDVDSEESMPNLIPAISTDDNVKAHTKGKRKKRGMIRTSRKHTKLSRTENASSKTISNCSNTQSLNACSIKTLNSSPSHGSEENPHGEDPVRKGGKRALSQPSPKRSPELRSKSKESGLPAEKNKKHKKYKERHKHHHRHHRHRHHHRHCHRHRHCRKHKHHKRTATVNEEQTSEVISVVIPSSASIPLGDIVTAKSTRSTTRDSETHCSGHSRKAKLPQAALAALANGPKSLEPEAARDKLSSLKTEDKACYS